MKAITSITELKRIARQPGVEIFAVCGLTNDDEVAVKVIKSDFLLQIAHWSDENISEANSRVSLDDKGNILFG